MFRLEYVTFQKIGCLTNEMVKEIIDSIDASETNISQRWKMFLSTLSDKCAKIEFVLDDKNSNEYAIVRYKINDGYKTDQIKENVEYLHNEIFKKVKEKNMSKKSDKKESRNPFDVDIDDTPLYPKTETDHETEFDSGKFSLDLSNIDIDKVIRETSQKIIGQDSAIESIVSNIYANQKIIQEQKNARITIKITNKEIKKAPGKNAEKPAGTAK